MRASNHCVERPYFVVRHFLAKRLNKDYQEIVQRNRTWPLSNKGKCQEPYAREEVLEKCFADLLKGLVFDDEVMDWVTEALHQSHADEKRFRDQTIAQLQAEHGKIQNRLDKLYEDRLDGFIVPAL